tara:strand:+ start:463 stop:1491 length:1029 start_codon:yes stop_codon:yes gene_type:complete
MTVLKENWHNLTKPSSVITKEGDDDIRKSTFVLESFDRGFGNTLGNALRRVLLSSLTGFAVTSVKIENALHEYGAIEGVKEDVIDIVMNIKQLAIIKENAQGCTLKLTSDKAGPVYAGSIQLPAGVEIANKDLLICTLAEGGKIDMQLNVEPGKGYVSADQQKNDGSVGVIAVDALFSPVKNVAYKVENSRVGQITDYDKLVIEIETNGSVTPRDALGIAAKILQDQLEVFVNFDVAKIDAPVQVEQDDEPRFNKNLLKTIDELELSVRSYNCLKNEDIIYVGDLVTKSESDMLKTANFGRKSLNELKDNLKNMGLNFGMKLPDWPPSNLDDLIKIKNKELV